MNIPTQIFREYDIRALADSELTDEVVYGIGRAFATILSREGKKRIGAGTLPDGAAMIGFFDSQEKSRIAVGTASNDSALVAILDKQGSVTWVEATE